MPRCPSLKGKNGIGGPTVRLSLGRGAGRRAEHGHRTHRNTSPPFLQLGKCRPRAPGGPRGRSARCGNGLFAQCVRLRSEINLEVHFLREKRYMKNLYQPLQPLLSGRYVSLAMCRRKNVLPMLSITRSAPLRADHISKPIVLARRVALGYHSSTINCRSARQP
mgnify:CR=1 FL=1